MKSVWSSRHLKAPAFVKLTFTASLGLSPFCRASSKRGSNLFRSCCSSAMGRSQNCQLTILCSTNFSYVILALGATRIKYHLRKDFFSSSSHPDTWQWLEQFCLPSRGRNSSAVFLAAPFPNAAAPLTADGAFQHMRSQLGGNTDC